MDEADHFRRCERARERGAATSARPVKGWACLFGDNVLWLINSQHRSAETEPRASLAVKIDVDFNTKSTDSMSGGSNPHSGNHKGSTKGTAKKTSTSKGAHHGK
jgi:hypothetical protein